MAQKISDDKMPAHFESTVLSHDKTVFQLTIKNVALIKLCCVAAVRKDSECWHRNCESKVVG